jgi:hypothetical protein
VKSVIQVNGGIFFQVIPGARIVRIVTIRFTPPMVKDPQSNRRPRPTSVSPGPGEKRVESRGA